METELSYHPIREDEKQAICEWVYDGEYSIYNLPSYEEMKEKNMGFANPQKEKNFYTYFDNNTLVGFTNILEEETEVFIGIGVNPNCLQQRIWTENTGNRIPNLRTKISGKTFVSGSQDME